MGLRAKDSVTEPASVPAAEFTHNFGRYKMQAQRQAVPVSSHGTLVGYFVSPQEYEYFQQLKTMRRRVISTTELSKEEAQEIFSSKMDPRHESLDRLLDSK